MSLCRRVHCAMCEALAQMRYLAVAGAVSLPLFASGCSGVMNVAGNSLLSASEEDIDDAANSSPRAGSARKLQVPSLMAAENAYDESADDHRDRAAAGFDQFTTGSTADLDETAADDSDQQPRELPAPGALAALSGIQPSGDDTPRVAARERRPARVAASKRPPRPAPTGPVSIFADSALPADRGAPRVARGSRDDLRLAAAQEEIPARRNGNGGRNGNGSERTDFDPGNEDVMTVEQIVQWTAQNHPMLAAMRAQIGVAESKLVTASLWPNPQLTIDADAPTQESGGAEMTSRIMFTIPMGGKRSLAQQVADLGIRKAQLAVSRETEVVVDESIAAAMEVVYYQELLVHQADLVRLADELVQKLQGDAVSPAAKVTASVNQTDVDLQRLKSLSMLRVARTRLSRAMGFNPPRAVRVRATLPDTPAPTVRLETLLAAVRENRPEIAEARMAIAESGRSRALAMAEAIPDLEVGARFNDEFRAPGDALGTRFQFELPLFDRNEGGIAEADATHRLNQANLRLTEMTTLNDVVEAYAELEPMQRQLEAYRRKVPRLAKEAEEQFIKGFDVGEIDANKVVNELQRLGKLKIEHLNLRYQYNRVRAKIELYAGRSLDQLAEMEAAAPADAERGSPFRDDAEQPSPKPSTIAPPRAQPQRTAPTMPKARKEQVDSRVAHAKTPQNVVAASAESEDKPGRGLGLAFFKQLTQRKEKDPPKAATLPYGNAKPSAAAKSR